MNACSVPYPFYNGSQCLNNCSVVYNSTNFSCISSYPWPNALHINNTYSNMTKTCAASCPSGTFLNRNDSNCLSTCDYRNATLINGNTICESPGTAYCLKSKQNQISDGFLTCVDNCSATDLTFMNGSYTQCTNSCPSTVPFIQLSLMTCGLNCSNGFFMMNTSRSSP